MPSSSSFPPYARRRRLIDRWRLGPVMCTRVHGKSLSLSLSRSQPTCGPRQYSDSKRLGWLEGPKYRMCSIAMDHTAITAVAQRGSHDDRIYKFQVRDSGGLFLMDHIPSVHGETQETKQKPRREQVVKPFRGGPNPGTTSRLPLLRSPCSSL